MENTDGLSLLIRGDRFLGFPFIEDPAVAAGDLILVLETSPANRTGRAEIHGRAFVAEEGVEIGLFIEGYLEMPLLVVRFTAGGDPIPNIGPHFQAFLDESLPVY